LMQYEMLLWKIVYCKMAMKIGYCEEALVSAKK